MKTFIAAKIQNIRVTGKSIDYAGSASICPLLMKKAGIEPYEQVTIVNLANGQRWITYAIEAEQKGDFLLNGGAARLGEVGDRCLVFTYVTSESFNGARVLFTNHQNEVERELEYPL
ncbi:Aspartate 1-decarboxylase [Planctomycetales bacterium 10988]|nr:Aspartate 1-decarboxylase [Planctomycetales bacterium 10988]